MIEEYPPVKIDGALSFAVAALMGKVDRQGRPSILHALRVGMAARCDGERMAGFLHDVIEDTDVTAQMLLDGGVPSEVVDLVVLLTRQDGQPYEEYIDRVCDNAFASRVKMRDLADNMSLGRIEGSTDDLIRRYRLAYSLLSRRYGHP